uniref:flagellin N-terminal helical domain-containing protein n=1 Tax=Eubacterium cellulosolvens TaxID=29322 RepID=UPI0004809BBC|nr:flagellin [[Eubacterium] cellulosolvens]
MIIQHNIAVANAYRNMKSNRSGLSKNLEKLSSGYRINRSADDAAGLAISEEMRAKINGLNQAEMNVDDGIGLIQTADGAMTEVHAMLERGVTLTTQAANGTYNDVSRSAIQKELDELGGEIDRIFESTDFNGIKVLQGQHVTSETSRLEIIGGLPEGVTFDSDTATQKFMASTWVDPAPVSVDITYQYKEKNDQNEEITKTATITANVKQRYVSSEVDFSSYVDGATGAFNFTCCTCSDHYTANLVSGTQNSVEHQTDGKGNDHYIYNIGVDSATKSDIVGRIINAMSTNPQGHYTNLEASGSKLIIYDKRPITSKSNIIDDLNDHSLNSSYNLNLNSDSITKIVFNGTDNTFPINTLSEYNRKQGQVTEGLARTTTETEYAGTPDVVLQIGPTDKETLVVKLPRVCTETLQIDEVKVDTVSNASDAMEAYQNAIDQLSLERARLGAYENRLEHTRNYLGIASENTTAAESRIRDTDMAKEMAAYTKNNILAQAAQSMLAQANQSGQAVLSLLQG